jgi:hypothetical protein
MLSIGPNFTITDQDYGRFNSSNCRVFFYERIKILRLPVHQRFCKDICYLIVYIPYSVGFLALGLATLLTQERESDHFK